MIQAIKNFLKRFLPPPVNAFNREIERVLSAIEHQTAESQRREQILLKALAQQTEASQCREQVLLETLEQQTQAVQRKGQVLLDVISQQTQDTQRKGQVLLNAITEQAQDGRCRESVLLEAIGAHRSESFQQGQALISLIEQQTKNNALVQDDFKKRANDIRSQTMQGKRASEEAVWGEIFNQTIIDSQWLHNKAFSPGRWALGYPALYAVYRILNETKPKRILELGLGQSTRVIGQYAAAYPETTHYVVEHDQEWMDFFANDFPLPENTTMVQLDREMVPYKDAEAVRVFKGFSERFADEKFDFICIDAPLGGDMKQYARIDVLKMLPDCLADTFVITLDDSERSGEKGTLAEMERVLTENNICFATGRCWGKKDVVILTSENLKFVCSM